MHGPVGIAGDQHVAREQGDDREAVAVRNRQAAPIAGGSRDQQSGKGEDRELRRRGHQVRHDVSHKLLNGVARSQTSHSLFGRRIGPGDRSPGPISRLGRRQARGPAGPQGLYQVLPPSSAAPAAASLSALSTTPKMLSRSEEHTSELQSLMRISYAVFCLNKK